MLYHGSNIEIDIIDLEKCRPHKDFGKGFYTTTIKEQSHRMALRVVKRYGGSACITAFSIEDGVFENANLKTLIFDSPNEQWAQFVLNNRNPKFSDMNSQEYNGDCKYDIVKGPIANDDINFIFNQFMVGLVPMEYLIKQMEFKKLNNQVSFHTKMSISLLKKIEVFR
ncbi:MAG: DUF3990 domain-containing protein [Elusimicrobiota bacterium]|jgi:hypothetical protein|nr:DUF3990 domain-containing protein [Elusimicrobiota bacterium]